jgi:hypothetical protein
LADITDITPFRDTEHRCRWRALKVFAENSQHPGAPHFIIHSFDDPDHAILALPAARAYAAKPFTIMEKEVQAAAQLARGQKDDAVRLAKEAADVEATVAAPSGPPDPIKPAVELDGEMLLESGQPAQAAAAFEKSLERTPNRIPLVKDMAQASGSARNWPVGFYSSWNGFWLFLNLPRIAIGRSRHTPPSWNFSV